MGGHAVTQTMDMSLFADTALLEGAAKSSLQRAVVDGAGVVRHAVFEAMPGHGREKPERRTMGGPEFAQALEGRLEEEFDAAERDGGGGAGHFLFQREVEEILAQFLLGDEIGGFAIVFGQSPHCPDITGLSFG